jgi:hypothetical protein
MYRFSKRLYVSICIQNWFLKKSRLIFGHKFEINNDNFGLIPQFFPVSFPSVEREIINEVNDF